MKQVLRDVSKFGMGAVICLGSFQACKEEAKHSGDDNSAGNNESSEQSEGVVSTNSGGLAFYTGYDGVNDYSLLLPGSRDYTIGDSSVANIKKETVVLSAATVAELLAEVKAANSSFDANAETRFLEMLGREQAAYRITPKKSGQTTLSTSRGNRGGRDNWGSADAAIQLTVNNYTADQFSAGQTRYTTAGSGLLKACKSCHETGAEGAPPHELGNIKEISDAQGIQWITTGQLGTRTARITHTWEFNSDAEKQGILPYLRAKAAKDLETFTKLVFEERFQNFQIPNGPPPGN